MITQTPISVRMNTFLLDELDKEARLGYQNRNQLINKAVKFYLQMKDARRGTDRDLQMVLREWDNSLRW